MEEAHHQYGRSCAVRWKMCSMDLSIWKRHIFNKNAGVLYEGGTALVRTLNNI